MKTDARTAALAFISLFPKPEMTENSEFITENDSEVILHNFRFAEMAFPKNGLMLCPVSHVNFKYISMNCEHILGYSHGVLMKWGIEDFFAIVHPLDLPLVQQCLDFIKGIGKYDPGTHRFSTQYRIKNKEGKYVHIRDEKFAIKTESNKYLHLILLSNVSNEEKFHHVKLDVYRNFNGSQINSYTYSPKQQEKVITPRQNDIARLIMKGFTNQEIADQLSVSVYTVKNHKQSLFRKVNVRSSIELANYVREAL